MRNAGAHLFCLSSSIVCCEVSQCDFLSLNIFFDLLSVAFIAATKRSHTAPFKKIYCTVRNEVKIKTCLGKKKGFHILLLLCSCCHKTGLCLPVWGHPLRTGCVVLFSEEKTALCRSLLWDDRVNLITDRSWQNVKTSPCNPLRRRRISTCKMTGTALSKVF